METNAEIQKRLAAQNKPSSKKTKGKAATPTEDNADTLNNPPAGNPKGVKTSISGLPLGFQPIIVPGRTEPGGTTYPSINVAPVLGARAQYTAESPYTIVANLQGNQERADLLSQMASIPGLYATDPKTDSFIKAMGPALSFRAIDYAALTKLMIHADQTGQDYTKSAIDFSRNPASALAVFGSAKGPKKIRLTSIEALAADLDAKYQDLFEIPVDKKTAAAYAKEFNKAELAAGGAGLTETQQKNIFNKYVEQTALARFKAVKATTDTADDAQLEQGVLGKLMRTFRGAYSDNGMAVSERQIYKDALAGMQSTASFNNKMESINLHASTAFPALKDWVAKGNTVKQYLDGGGFTESYAKIYGVPVGTVTPDKFANAFAGAVPLTVKDWESTQWKDPKIKQTQFYQDTKKNDLRAMADAFGINV